MPEQAGSQEPFDAYSDQFTITLTPFGANLSFSVREAHPSPTVPPQIKKIGTIRMSTEHLKSMVFIMRRQVLQVEAESGVKAEIPISTMNQMGIAPEDWDNLWKSV